MPRFKIEAVGGHVRIDIALYEKLLREAVDKTTGDALGDFKRTTRTWNTKVDFRQVKAKRMGATIEGAAGTNSKVYRYVTRGTKAHTIRPARASTLHFLSNYRAKTSPRILGSHQGGASGSDVFAQEVHHPGTQAREFEEEIAKRRQKTLETYTQVAMLRASKGRRG